MALSALIVAVGSSAAWQFGARVWFQRLPVARPIVVTQLYDDRSDTLRRNEPLSALFARAGVNAAELYHLLRAAPAIDSRRTPAGQVFELRYRPGESVPVRVAVRLDPERVVRVTRGDSGWQGRVERIRWRVDRERTAGAIRYSLYESLHDAISDNLLGAPERDRFIADLADRVFGWEIDFSRDVVEGDRFDLIWERLTSSEGDVRYGRLLAARVETRGTSNPAYLLPDSSGANAYFDANGISLRRAFKRYPVAFLRISSNFSRRRLHPVLGLWRSHRGTDYAARLGTEIYATGDGTVRLAGRNGGYGLMVSLRHPRGIETRYAHMLRIKPGVAPGVLVKQGDAIGYVGASGLVNGPHVHYEFLQYGVQLNPRSVNLGDGAPLPAARFGEFEVLRSYYDHLLEGHVSQNVVVGGQ